MLDAIAEIDNLGMEDSTFAADAPTTGLDLNTALGESQGSSIQTDDFDQSLTGMMSSLETPADGTNPSLRIVSGQSLEDALADAIPGLDPTTITPPAPLLAQESSLSSLGAPNDAIPGLDPTTITPPAPLAQESSLPSLGAPDEDTNPSLRIVSGQSLEDALADAIPGLDPTTVTPPPPLAEGSSLSIAEDSSLNPFMMAALTELGDVETIGEAFQTVSDGFEGLSNSFEQLAASFLSQEGNDALAIAADRDNASAALEKMNVAIGDIGDNASADLEKKNVVGSGAGDDTDINVNTDPVAIAGMSSSDNHAHASLDSSSHSHEHGNDHSKKVAIADDADDHTADFGISNLISKNADTALGTDFDLDFDALKLNVDQVSRGLQFLVQQLEAAFESDDSALTAASTVGSSQ